MDPFTHGLIGLGVSGFSCGTISLHSPVCVSALLGSLAPDFDIVFQAKGDLFYLRHHRGVSHSIPGITVLSAVLSLPLAVLFPETSYWTLFFWHWLGAFSHCLVDILNSYGAELLWPVFRRKISVNLLNIFDPYLFLLLLVLLFAHINVPAAGKWTVLLLIFYLTVRFVINRRIRKLLFQRFGSRAKRILVMPALKGNWTWDVFVETKDSFLVGQIYSFSLMFRLRRKLCKQQNSLIKMALEGRLGRLFREFTPLYHVSLQPMENGHLVRFVDLRYCLKKQFLHTGTAFIDKENKVVEEVFSPYLGKRNIKLVG